MLNGETIVARSPEAIDVRVGGALILHEPDSGRYVKLNATAADLWSCLRAPLTFQALSAEFAGRHGIGIARAQSDLRLALEALIDRGLARAASPASDLPVSDRDEHAAPREAVDGSDSIVA